MIVIEMIVFLFFSKASMIISLIWSCGCILKTTPQKKTLPLINKVHKLVAYCCWLQIERQLNAYMRRVEDVLGKGWENHVDGQKLKADGDSFKMKLNTQELFDEWTRKVCSLLFFFF